MNAPERAVPERESLTVEFKSDRSRLSDRDLVAAVVCLANTEGGDIYLGVERDGRITGVHPEHQNLTSMAAMIANRTSPSVSVRVTAIAVAGTVVARVEVPKSPRLTATSEGTLLRRRLQADGTPQCMPLYPHEFITRQSDIGLLDYSALPAEGATTADLDPLERQRLRQMVELYHGDHALATLADDELDSALGFVRSDGERRVPTVTGLLLIGHEVAIRRHLPTHEVAFQVLDGTQVRVNEFYRGPLIRVFETIMGQFSSRLKEEEVQVGLFRVPIPEFDRRAFREAIVNALVHRDYTRQGAVHVRWQTDGMVISNPGGFVEGVSLANLLVVEPRPRNPLLADTIKRVGLAERTGRGVDLIYEGLLRYGRPAPDYSGSDPTTVVVRLSSADADLPFARLVLEEEKRVGRRLPLDALIILSRLRSERRLGIHEAAAAIQRNEAATRAVLERLVEAGLVEGIGATRGRSYTLSARVYRIFGEKAGYVRQVGFDRIQQEQMVLKYALAHGRVARNEVVSLCGLGPHQATRLLRSLAHQGKLIKRGERRGAFYEPAP